MTKAWKLAILVAVRVLCGLCSVGVVVFVGSLLVACLVLLLVACLVLLLVAWLVRWVVARLEAVGGSVWAVVVPGRRPVVVCSSSADTIGSV